MASKPSCPPSNHGSSDFAANNELLISEDLLETAQKQEIQALPSPHHQCCGQQHQM
jgi:hypothetical protein